MTPSEKILGRGHPNVEPHRVAPLTLPLNTTVSVPSELARWHLPCALFELMIYRRVLGRSGAVSGPTYVGTERLGKTHTFGPDWTFALLIGAAARLLGSGRSGLGAAQFRAQRSAVRTEVTVGRTTALEEGVSHARFARGKYL